MADLSGALTIEPEKCTGCKQCELACSWIETGSFQPSKSVIRVHVFDEQVSFAPYACFQCEEAWCMKACPVNAIDVDDSTGAKIVIDEVCVGCKLCVIACPFGTIFFDKSSDTATKCDLWAREYVGGRGVAARYFYDEVDPRVDALSPENKLIFAIGPLTGTNASCGARPSYRGILAA